MVASVRADRGGHRCRLLTHNRSAVQIRRKIPILVMALALVMAFAGTAAAHPMTPEEHGLPNFGSTQAERSPYADILTQNRLGLPPVPGGDLSHDIRSPAWPVIFADDFGPSRFGAASDGLSPWLPDNRSIAAWRRLQGFSGSRIGAITGRSGLSDIAIGDPQAARSDSEFVLSLIAEIENPTIQSLAVRLVQPTRGSGGAFKLSVPGIWSPPTPRAVDRGRSGPQVDRLVIAGEARRSPSARRGTPLPQADDFGDLPVRSVLALAVRILNFITDPFVVATIFAIAFGLAALRIAQQIGTAKRRRHNRRHRYHLGQPQDDRTHRAPHQKRERETVQQRSKPRRRRRSSRRGRFHLRRRRTPSTAGVRPG